MNAKFIAILEKIKKLFYNYPLVLLMSLATATIIITGIEKEASKDLEFQLLKLGLTFSLGISLLFALKILSQRVNNGIIWQTIGLLFLVGFYFIFPKKEDDFSDYYAFIIVPTFVLSHLLVSFIAYTKKENSEYNFWQFNKNLFVNLFLTGVFTGVLIGGVELAILAVEKLFNWDIKNEVYAETFLGLAVFGSTFIFLLFNETGLDYLEKEGNYPVVLKFFTQFILIPLLIIYVVILYFYSLKIVIHWELPRGWVSYLVLAYSIVGILALLLVHPLKQLKVKSWIIIFSKVFYYTLIPLIFLLFTAIFTRVLQYGYTEARYFVLLISLWLTTVVLYFVFSKKDSIKFIPISLFLFGTFALTFPYFNAFSVSKRSQEKELTQVLLHNNLLVKGKIDFNKSIVDSVKYEIEDKFQFLSKRFDTKFIEPLLNDTIKAKVKHDKYWYTNLFKNVIYTYDKDTNYYLRIYTELKTRPIQGYQFVINPEYEGNFEVKLNNDTLKIVNSYSTNSTFKISINNTSKDIIPLIKAICDKYKNASKDVLVDDLSVTTVIDNYEIKVLFDAINWQKKENMYSYSNVMYLIKTN